MQTDWNIISNIVCCFGGAATVFIAMISYMQFKQSNNKSVKLKVEYRLNFLHSFIASEYIGAQFTLKIMNKGSKKVTITGWGIKAQQTYFSIIHHSNDINFPVTIEPNDSLTLAIPIDDLYRSLTTHIQQNLFKENTKFTFCVHNNFEETYPCKSNITYKEIKSYATLNINNNSNLE